MKKIIIAFLMLLALPSLAIANSNDESKIEAFMNKPGTLFIRNLIKLDRVKDIECQVLVLTDMETNQKMGVMQIDSPYYGQAGKSQSILDDDEIEACIKGLQSLKNTMKSFYPVTYTEIICNSKTGLKFGAYFNDNNWTPYINNNDYTTSMGKYLTSADIDALIAQMEKARQIINSQNKDPFQ